MVYPTPLPRACSGGDGNYRQAVEHYAKAVELDPQNEGFQADLRAAEEKIREVEASAVPTPAFDFAGVAPNAPLASPGRPFPNRNCAGNQRHLPPPFEAADNIYTPKNNV